MLIRDLNMATLSIGKMESKSLESLIDCLLRRIWKWDDYYVMSFPKISKDLIGAQSVALLQAGVKNKIIPC